MALRPEVRERLTKTYWVTPDISYYGIEDEDFEERQHVMLQRHKLTESKKNAPSWQIPLKLHS